MLEFFEMVALTTFVVTITGLLLAGVIHLALTVETAERAKRQLAQAASRRGYWSAKQPFEPHRPPGVLEARAPAGSAP